MSEMCSREPNFEVKREPNCEIKREPVEDPWAFVYGNFYGLAVYYAMIYAKVTKHYELTDDFKVEMLYAMVTAYTTYRHLPLRETVKILKTIPMNYYGSKVKRKHLTTQQVPIENIAIIADEDRFQHLYDKYYEKFLDEQYRLDDAKDTDERRVLLEILYPSQEFQDYIRQERVRFGMSKTMLRGFFHTKYKWNNNYFDQVFANISIAA